MIHSIHLMSESLIELLINDPSLLTTTANSVLDIVYKDILY